MNGGRVAYDKSTARWVWRCSGCGKQDFWGETWVWFGSARDEDDGTFQWVACSGECMKRKPK